MNLYAITYVALHLAFDDQGEAKTEHHVEILACPSEEEALQIATDQCYRICPTQHGWKGHSIQVKEVPKSWMRGVVREEGENR